MSGRAVAGLLEAQMLRTRRVRLPHASLQCSEGGARSTPPRSPHGMVPIRTSPVLLPFAVRYLDSATLLRIGRSLCLVHRDRCMVSFACDHLLLATMQADILQEHDRRMAAEKTAISQAQPTWNLTDPPKILTHVISQPNAYEWASKLRTPYVGTLAKFLSTKSESQQMVIWAIYEGGIRTVLERHGKDCFIKPTPRGKHKAPSGVVAADAAAAPVPLHPAASAAALVPPPLAAFASSDAMPVPAGPPIALSPKSTSLLLAASPSGEEPQPKKPRTSFAFPAAPARVIWIFDV